MSKRRVSTMPVTTADRHVGDDHAMFGHEFPALAEEIASIGLRDLWCAGDVLSTGNPSTMINPKIIPPGQSMSFFRTATDRVTSGMAVQVSTAVGALVTDIVDTRRLLTCRRGG
ncbi:hypothetical protein [Streptomyces cadmiisoli]|uniref:hypothetical protein n=1 Tax=Streptomyces cadmiisoli TaxID=2184053 RepID=UPI003D70689A